jgi:uncharacterized membrane protein
MNYKNQNELAKLHPTQGEFLEFLRNTLVWIGAISLIMSLLFFMAFNWEGMGKFAKFLMVEVVMFASVTLYMFLDKYKLVQEVLLMLSSITLGILLALIGQTYQTGADPWQLFALWAILMPPWAIVAGASSLWLLWILLFNLATLLYFQKFELSFFTIFEMKNDLLLLLFTLNAILWIVWETLALKYKSFSSQLALKFLIVLSLAAISTLVIVNMYEYYDDNKTEKVYFLLYGLSMSVIYYVYRIKMLNVSIMALWTLSLLMVSISLFIRFLSHGFFDFLLFLLLFVAVATTLSIIWLKKLNRELI